MVQEGAGAFWGLKEVELNRGDKSYLLCEASLVDDNTMIWSFCWSLEHHAYVATLGSSLKPQIMLLA